MNPVRVLAIDIGTSSVRSALFDMRGRRLVETTAQQRYTLAYTPDGGAELSPTTMRDAALRCLRQTLRQHSGPVQAVGVSCFWHSLLGTDAKGAPLTPIYTWGDSRSHLDAVRLRKKLSEKTIHARTGCMLRPSYWPAKLLWLRREHRSAARWLSPGEWLLWQFGGQPQCSFSMASGTGLLNITKCDWDEPMLEICRVRREQLSPLSDEPMSCSAIPQLRDAQWFPAIGDGAAGNLGSGAAGGGLAAINFGTSAAVRIVRPSGMASFGWFRYRVDEARVVIGGAVSNAGNLRAWCLRELRVRKTGKVQSSGLTVLPFWVSERGPTWPEEMHGVICGLTQSTTANDLLEATNKAVFFRLADIAEKLGAKRYVISGGLTKSPPDLQRLADVLGRELQVCAEPEASLRGAAVFTLEKLGARIVPLSHGKVLHPRRKFAEEYAAARERQRILEKTLRGW